MPPLQLSKLKREGNTQELPSRFGRVRAHDFFFFICSVRFLFAAFRLFAVGIFYLQRSFLFAAYFFYLQRTSFSRSILFDCSVSFFDCSVSFLFAACLFCLQRFFFVCSVSFLFTAFLFCLRRFFFVCGVSFLFAAFLFCLQRVPCGPS